MDTPPDTVQLSGRLIAGNQVSGTTVYNNLGEKLGTVDDVMIDKVSGRIAYAVLSSGGFLGIGDSRYPLPWNALKYDLSLEGFVVDIAGLESAPTYTSADPANWDDPTWAEKVHSHYNAQPYWAAPHL